MMLYLLVSMGSSRLQYMGHTMSGINVFVAWPFNETFENIEVAIGVTFLYTAPYKWYYS